MSDIMDLAASPKLRELSAWATNPAPAEPTRQDGAVRSRRPRFASSRSAFAKLREAVWSTSWAGSRAP